MSQQLPLSEGRLQHFVSRPPTGRRLCQKMMGTGDSQMSPLLDVLLALIPNSYMLSSDKSGHTASSINDNAQFNAVSVSLSELRYVVLLWVINIVLSY